MQLAFMDSLYMTAVANDRFKKGNGMKILGKLVLL